MPPEVLAWRTDSIARASWAQPLAVAVGSSAGGTPCSTRSKRNSPSTKSTRTPVDSLMFPLRISRGQRILDLLLDHALERPSAVGRVVALAAAIASSAASRDLQLHAAAARAASPGVRPADRRSCESARGRADGRRSSRRCDSGTRAGSWLARLRSRALRISSSLPLLRVICWISWLPMFVVITMIVFVKSTVRPWLSVRRPSSSTCSSTLNTSRWAFSISSSRSRLIRSTADRFGQLATLFVADVARRGADQAADRVPLHELAHVDADHGVLVVEHALRPAPCRVRFCRRRSARGK